MKKLCFLIVLLSFQSFGQEEMSKWFFGNGAALDFSSGCPMPIGGSQVTTIESSSSISTANGFLRFYTDGVTIYNRNNEVMTNGDGLLGELSSTNGALIVPKPGNSQQYYVFTGDAIQHYQLNGDGNGINYSIVDMTGSGGLGSVIDKNINLLVRGSEKLTAIRHSNGIDYWVLTHFENRFYAYPITVAGVGSPIITTLGINISSSDNIRGTLKVSPDGSKLVTCHSFFDPILSGQINLYDFNSTTGTVSNEVILGNDVVYYGADFSPNSQVLYANGKESINGGDDTGNTRLFQYDLQAANIASTRYELANYLSSPFVNLAGLLQVGIDTKMYHSFGGLKLSVIRQPNRLGANCGFQFRALGLGSNTASIGLPNGVQSYYDNIIEYEDLCFGESTSFYLNSPRDIASALWNFGDPSTGPSNQSTEINPVHTFSAAGSYTVTCEVIFTDGEVRTFQVIVKSIIAPQLVPAVLTQCDTDGVDDGRSRFNLLEALDLVFVQDVTDTSGITLIFYETEADALMQINAIENPQNYESLFDGQVIYTSIFQSLDCFKTTTVTLIIDPAAAVEDLDLTVCASVIGEESWVVLISSIVAGVAEVYPNEEIRIYESLEDAGLQIGEQEGSEVIQFAEPRIFYYRLGEPDECIGIGLITLTVEPPLELEDKELILCYTEEGTFLEGPQGFASYLWNTGETTQNIEIEEPGLYSLEVQLFAGCSGVVNYTVAEGPLLQAEISVNDFQLNNEILIEASLSEGTILYSIDGGNTFSTSGNFSNLTPGTYIVVIADQAGCNRIIETVVVRGAPRFFTPNSDGYNDRWHVINAQNYEGMEVEIYDRFGKPMATLTDRSEGWDGVYNGKQLATNTYWYSIKYEGTVNYGYFTLIVRNL